MQPIFIGLYLELGIHLTLLKTEKVVFERGQSNWNFLVLIFECRLIVYTERGIMQSDSFLVESTVNRCIFDVNVL